MSRTKSWTIRCWWNPWLSFGVHVDHEDPHVAIHLPLVNVIIGRLTNVDGPADARACRQCGGRGWVPNMEER